MPPSPRQVYVSYLEVYNEIGYDLLDDSYESAVAAAAMATTTTAAGGMHHLCVMLGSVCIQS